MKRYNTPHRSRVVKTRMTEEEYAEFAERLSAYNMSQAEFIRQAITGAAIRPISDYVIADSKGEPLAASQFQRVWQYVVVRSTKPRNYYKYVNGQSIKYTVTPTLGMTQKNQPKIRYTLDFDVTPHQLRHTYITNLLYAGVDPKTVQYVTVNEVNSNQKFDLIRKSILSILQTKNAYDIMPVGKMIRLNSFITQQKPQSCDL